MKGWSLHAEGLEPHTTQEVRHYNSPRWFSRSVPNAWFHRGSRGGEGGRAKKLLIQA